MAEIIPLRNIPIRIIVDGEEVTGEIDCLTPNNMSVVILSPVSGLGTGLHVPAIAMAPVNWLATYTGRTTTAITERGRSRAKDLLRELYDYSRGRPSGWGISSVGPKGWKAIPPPEGPDEHTAAFIRRRRTTTTRRRTSRGG